MENDRLKKELDNRTNENMIQRQGVDRYNYIVREFLLPYAQGEKSLF